MKILNIYKAYFPQSVGGIEEAIRIIANFMYKQGHVSDVFTFSNKKYFKKKFQNHYIYNNYVNFEIASTPFSINSLKNFSKTIENYDLLHFHYPFPFGDLLNFFINKNKPYIITYHSDIIKQKFLKNLYYPLQENFLSNSEKIICTSENYMATSKNLKRYKRKVEVIVPGIEVKKKSYDISKIQHTLDKSKPYILFLGNLRNYKGLMVLLKASKNVKGNVVIAGDGEYFNKLKKYVSKNKLENVILTGAIDENYKTYLLKNSQGLVLPSNKRSEAFGLVLLEAAMYGKPLICTEIGTGTSFVNEHDVTGLIVRPDDSAELSNAINFIFYHKNLAKKMGQNAEKKITRIFRSERMCKDYERLYLKILNGK